MFAKTEKDINKNKISIKHCTSTSLEWAQCSKKSTGKAREAWGPRALEAAAARFFLRGLSAAMGLGAQAG